MPKARGRSRRASSARFKVCRVELLDTVLAQSLHPLDGYVRGNLSRGIRIIVKAIEQDAKPVGNRVGAQACGESATTWKAA